MKNLLKLGIGLIIAAMAIMPATAQNMIRIGDATITYESGSIDPENLNGNARDVIITADNGNTIAIDHYKFETSPAENQTKIDIFDVKGVVISEDGNVVTIQHLTWTDLVLPVEDFNFNDLMFDDRFLDQIENFGHFKMTNLDYFEDGQQNMHIDGIAFDSAMVDVPNLSNVPIQDVSLTLDHMVIAVDASQDQDFRDLMGRLGLNQFVINAYIESIVDVKNDRVDNNIRTAIEFKGMALVEFDMSIGLLNSSLQILNAAVKQPEAIISDELVALMFTGGMFNSTRLMIEDQGILALGIEDLANDQGITKEEVVGFMMDQLAINMGSFAPLTFAQVAPDIRNFLNQGGSLTIALTPATPTVFSSFLGFAAVPDTAAEVLGLSVQHYP